MRPSRSSPLACSLTAIALAGVALVGTALDSLAAPNKRQAVPGPAPSQAETAAALSQPVDHLDALAREPMIAEHPAGTLFVTGYGSEQPTLWRSTDRGATWSRVNVGSAPDGAIGNSDVDLAIAADGTIYYVVMSFDRKTFEGLGIAMAVSRDAGATWSWTGLSKTRYDDRPWVEVTPDGTAHVIWNDGGGVCHAVSRDAGRTWKEQPRIHAEGGSSHLAVGPKGEIAVRITPVSASGHVLHKGVDLVAVSTDGGATWTKRAAPGTREWTYPFPMDRPDPMPRWVEPLAWDASGALYSLWTDPSGLFLARSTDRGATWRTWRLAEGGALRYYPYLVARGRGELAATWFSGQGASMRAHVARIQVDDGPAAPRVTAAEPFAPDSWRRRTPGPPTLYDTAGEYFPVAFLRDGRLAVVTTIQDEGRQRLGFSVRWWR